jgi:hypothetical protein
VKTIIALLSLVWFTGCVASLETARASRSPKPVAATALLRPESECRTLDDIHMYSAYGAEFALGIGTGAGVLAAATEGKMQTVGIDVGIGAAVTAATLGYLSQSYGATWTKECSQ